MEVYGSGFLFKDGNVKPCIRKEEEGKKLDGGRIKSKKEEKAEKE